MSAYAHLFGPVPSRRLGMSLGVDMVPAKICTLDCVYCECGGTTALTAKRREYVPTAKIRAELDDFLSTSPILDVVTFTGSGEPTLHSGVGSLITYVRQRYPRYKTALLTNSTLLHIPEVRQSVLAVDYALPSLDAVSDAVFTKINRPSGDIDARMVIDGLVAFSKEYEGILWVEVFIVPGINDSDSELSLLKSVLTAMKLSRVQLNTLDRPGACEWVEPAKPQRLREIARFFAPLPVEIISRNMLPTMPNDSQTATVPAILSILKRRPSTVEDLSIACRASINELQLTLKSLVDKGEITSALTDGKLFYRLA
jgi:wyosine [tRNA(Phe)-imidazoG37] synthetase (radical SAM superfamily)